ncbi:MAG: DUF456 domain-containing protein [Treponema sp.]|nr:DUF456 domain-containing protein [Treponema sp.]
MELVLIILAFLLLAAGLLGVVIPILPGPPLSYIGILVLQLSGRSEFTFVFMITWAIITVAITIIDYLLPALLSKRFGGSRAASIGSILGLLAGIFLFPPLGLVIGPFLGALAGELIYQATHGAAFNKKAIKVAFGAFLAFIVGTGAKLIVCSLMLFHAIRALV